MELKERIVEEASGLFFTKGIKSITMSDIANHMGISKRTLYEVFKDKEALLEECLVRNMERGNMEMRELINESDNVIDAMMRIYAKHLNNMHKINKSTIHDLKKYHPRLYKSIECKQKEDTNNFYPLFKKGVEQGLLRDDVNFEILMWLLKAQFKMLMEGEFIPLDKYPIEDFVSAIILNFTRGIATTEGDKLIDEMIKKVDIKRPTFN